MSDERVNTGQTPIQLILDAAALADALRRYAAAYDHFATEEQVLVAEGRYDDAQAAHVIALHCLHAWQKEDKDPAPRTIQRDHDDREGAWPE